MAKKEVKMEEDVLLGKKVSSWSVKNSQDKTVKSTDLKGKKYLLYFYPKDNTPGCTTEGQEFSDLAKAYKKEGVEIFGVSKDSVKSHDKFKCMFNFEFELLSDEEGKLCDLFDVIKEKNMYGKKYMGIERSTFVIDENQKVVLAYRKVKAEGHAQKVLEDIKKM